MADDAATHVVGDDEWFPKPPRTHSAAVSAAAAAAEIAALRRELRSKPRTSWWRRMLAAFR